jgi:hypothetical protein
VVLTLGRDSLLQKQDRPVIQYALSSGMSAQSILYSSQDASGAVSVSRPRTSRFASVSILVLAYGVDSARSGKETPIRPTSSSSERAQSRGSTASSSSRIDGLGRLSLSDIPSALAHIREVTWSRQPSY